MVGTKRVILLAGHNFISPRCNTNIDGKLITEFVALSEKKEKCEKYGFGTYEIENQLAENILKRNYILKIIL